MAVVWCYVLFMMVKWCFSNIDGGSIVFHSNISFTGMGRRQSIGLYSLETFQFLIKIGGKTWKTYKIKHFCLSLNAFDVDILQVKFWACHKKKIATVATSEGAVLPPTMSGLHPIHQTRQDVISSVMIINIQEDDN